LLVEPAATNLALHSRDLANAVWVKTNVTAAKNALGADAVASGATTLTATAASGTVLQTVTAASGERTFSAYVRRVTGTGTVQMTMDNGTTWTAITLTTSYAAIRIPTVTNTNPVIGFRILTSGDAIAVDFTQLEAGAVNTSVIPTTTAAATRNADVISKTGVSGFIGQTEGTLYIDLDYTQPPNDSSGRLLNVYGTNDTTNSILSFINNVNQFQLTTFSGGASDVPIPASAATIVPFGQNKFAIAYNGVNFTVYRNGLLFASGTGLAPASLTAIILGSSLFNTRSINNRIRAAAIYTTRLSNSELASLTSL
jgi:hypothetical protein